MWCDHYTWKSYRAEKAHFLFSPPFWAKFLAYWWTVCDIICKNLHEKKQHAIIVPYLFHPCGKVVFFKSPSQRGKIPSLALPQNPFQSCYVPKSHTTLHIIKMCCFVVICLLYCKSRPFYSFKHLAENVNSSCPTSLCMLVC